MILNINYLQNLQPSNEEPYNLVLAEISHLMDLQLKELVSEHSEIFFNEDLV